MSAGLQSGEERGRIAIIGAGAFGRFCIDTYRHHSAFDLIAVGDSSDSALAQVQAPGVRLLSDWREIMADNTIEAVHLATPPWLRGEMIEAAFAAGKSVFCEKPLALTLPDADTFIAAADRQGLALGVDYVMRHLPAYRLLERLASSRLLGLPRTCSFVNFAQRVPPGHWFWDEARSGGILVEHGVHFLDAYGRIMGGALEVWGRAPRPEAVDAGIHHEGGGLSRHYHEFDFPSQIEHAAGTTMFERGHVVIEGWIPTRIRGAALASVPDLLEILAPGSGAIVVDEGEHTTFNLDFPHREASYRAAIAAGMLDVVRRHRDPNHRMQVDPQDARESLAVALACRTAIRSGRTIAVERW